MSAARALALLVALTVCGCGQAPGRDDTLPAALYDAVASAEVGDIVDLKPVLGDEWDRLVLLEGNHTEEDVSAALGFAWKDYRFGMAGEGTVAIFVSGGTVTRWAYLPEVNAASSGNLVQADLGDDYWMEVDPSDTTFQVKDVQPDGPIEICYRRCA